MPEMKPSPPIQLTYSEFFARYSASLKTIPFYTSYALAQTLNSIDESYPTLDSRFKITLSYGRRRAQLRMVDETGNTVATTCLLYLQLRALQSSLALLR